jgi:hypothetical protein
MNKRIILIQKRQSIGATSQSNNPFPHYSIYKQYWRSKMFNSYKKQSDVLEKFRIHAHLRSYVKEPIIVDEKLLQEAVTKLKKLPFEYRDPTDSIAVELVLDSYRLGYFKLDDLTNVGCDLVRQGKYRGHLQLSNNRVYQNRISRNRHNLNTV